MLRDSYKGVYMQKFSGYSENILNAIHLKSCENVTWRKYRRRPISAAFCIAVLVVYCLLRVYRLPVELMTYYELIASTDGAHKCKVPILDPYDPSILKYIEKPKPIVCKKIQPMLTYLDSITSELVLNETAVKAEGMGMAQILCQYRCFAHNSGVGDDEPKVTKYASAATSCLIQYLYSYFSIKNGKK